MQSVNAKQQVSALLEEAGQEYLSGNAIAKELGITRAAVWKCIRQMEEDGYRVEVTRKGYRLSEESDAVSKNAFHQHPPQAHGPRTEGRREQ